MGGGCALSPAGCSSFPEQAGQTAMKQPSLLGWLMLSTSLIVRYTLAETSQGHRRRNFLPSVGAELCLKAQRSLE